MTPTAIQCPPDRRYLAWQKWVQEQLKSWMSRCTATCQRHGMSSWVYWGDCHVGMEPYLGGVAATNIRELDKPVGGSAVKARMLVDFPGDTYRRCRLAWLSAPEIDVTNTPEFTTSRLMSSWTRARRGLLMNMPRGLYWMPFERSLQFPKNACANN